MRGFNLPALACVFCVWTGAFAQDRHVIGNVGQATDRVGVYTYPNWDSRRLYLVDVGVKMVVSSSPKSTWYRVLLRHGDYGYIPAQDVDVLPLVVYAKPHPRSELLASRGGTRTLSYGSQIADVARNYEGVPYEWGGNSLSNGVDCSGFVKELEGSINGVNLPRTAAEQALVGTPITRLQDLRPGDRLYFQEPGDSKISHTGIYVGGPRYEFVHASHGKGKVTTDTLLKLGWRKILVAARR